MVPLPVPVAVIVPVLVGVPVAVTLSVTVGVPLPVQVTVGSAVTDAVAVPVDEEVLVGVTAGGLCASSWHAVVRSPVRRNAWHKTESPLAPRTAAASGGRYCAAGGWS